MFDNMNYDNTRLRMLTSNKTPVRIGILLIIWFFSEIKTQTCGVGYPHVIGGISGNTIPLMLDMHPDSGKIAVSGRSCDKTVLIGEQWTPCDSTFVALYSGTFMSLTWLTAININQHGQLITFSPDGSYLAVYASGTSNAKAIFFIESANG